MESKSGAIGLTVFGVLLAGVSLVLAGCGKEPVGGPKPGPEATAPKSDPQPRPEPDTKAAAPADPKPDPKPDPQPDPQEASPKPDQTPPSDTGTAPAPTAAPKPGSTPSSQDGAGETDFSDRPEFVRKPVMEPEMPLDLEKGAKYDYLPLRDGGGFVFEREMDGERISGVVIPGASLVTRGFVELFGCGEGGKTHETVFRLDCDILALDTGFTLAGFKRGPLPEQLGIDDPKQGERIIALIQWNDEQGNLITRRSEDMVLSTRMKKPMPRVGWTYVGHWIEVPDPTSDDPDRKHKILGAAQSRSLVTTFRDKTSLLDCPLADAVDDSSYLANYMVIPRSGTPVRVIFRTTTKAEREEIARLEEEEKAHPFVPGHPEDNGPK